MQISVCCWLIQTTMQSAGHFTFRSVGPLPRCNTRTMFPCTLRPHFGFRSEPSPTGRAKAVHWQPYRISLWLASAFPSLRADTTARADRNKEPMQLQAFRSDALPLLSSCYTAFLFTCGDEFCSDGFMEFFVVLCYKLATMLGKVGGSSTNTTIGSENTMEQLRAVCLSVVQQQKNA